MLIVKFTDFQCPVCGSTHKDYKPDPRRYQAEVPGAVKLVSKNYPLQPECNANVPRPVHSAACDAAVAVDLARAKGRGDAMEDWLYANQALISPAFVRDGARTVGMVQDFAPQYPRVLEEVKADVALGRLLGVTLDADLLHQRRQGRGGALAPQYFDMAIAYELRKAGKIKWPEVHGGVAVDNRPGARDVLAIETENLTKDYAPGFWRKRPVPRARSADAAGRSRARSSAFSARTAPARRRRSSC